MSSRQAAQVAIDAKTVTVSGAIAEKASRQVATNEPIEILGPRPRFVSRGGEKLQRGLDSFGVSVAGKRCVDVGASTGGFTDCLLQNGAELVYAVDVGYGQLDDKIRHDPKVHVIERLNARQLKLDHVDNEAVEIGVVDVSFISLALILPALAQVVTPNADIVCLIKPQFEARREQVGRKGIISDPDVWDDVLQRISVTIEKLGLFMIGTVASPIRGAQGNVEFLGWIKLQLPDGIEPMSASTLREIALSAKESS